MKQILNETKNVAGDRGELLQLTKEEFASKFNSLLPLTSTFEQRADAYFKALCYFKPVLTEPTWLNNFWLNVVGGWI